MDASKAPPQQALDALLASYGTGDFATAKQLALAMTSQYPGFAFGWKVLGELLSQSGQLADALGAMQQAASLDPGDAQSHLNIAITQSLETYAFWGAFFVQSRPKSQISPPSGSRASCGRIALYGVD